LASLSRRIDHGLVARRFGFGKAINPKQQLSSKYIRDLHPKGLKAQKGMGVRISRETLT
jgi:hypothetical protein